MRGPGAGHRTPSRSLWSPDRLQSPWADRGGERRTTHAPRRLARTSAAYAAPWLRRLRQHQAPPSAAIHPTKAGESARAESHGQTRRRATEALGVGAVPRRSDVPDERWTSGYAMASRALLMPDPGCQDADRIQPVEALAASATESVAAIGKAAVECQPVVKQTSAIRAFALTQFCERAAFIAPSRCGTRFALQ